MHHKIGHCDRCGVSDREETFSRWYFFHKKWLCDECARTVNRAFLDTLKRILETTNGS